MSTELLRRLKATDPYPTGSPLPEGWSERDVLVEIERRMRMETITRDERAKDRGTRRLRGAAVGAAAFAVVVTIVGVAAWLAGGEESPVHSPDPADPIATAQAFAAAVSAGETDLSGLVTPDATYTRVDNWTIDADLVEYWAALGTRITLSDCTVTALLVTCEGTHTNVIYEALDRQLAETWTFLMRDGLIEQVLEDWGGAALEPEIAFPVEDYLAWLYVNRPDWVDDVEYVDPDYGHTSFGQLNTLPEAFLILNRHNAEILTTHLDAYRADLEATGGLPDEWSPDRWGVPAEG
jgi:hypothetical protein